MISLQKIAALVALSSGLLFFQHAEASDCHYYKITTTPGPAPNPGDPNNPQRYCARAARYDCETDAPTGTVTNCFGWHHDDTNSCLGHTIWGPDASAESPTEAIQLCLAAYPDIKLSCECPDTEEVCDLVDNDRDGLIDEDNVCAETPRPDKCKTSKRFVSDPVDMASKSVFVNQEDFSVSTPAGEFHFERHFVSDKRVFKGGQNANNGQLLHGLPKPFGSVAGDESALKWWHNLFSFVAEGPTEDANTRTYVRNTTGQLLAYDFSCSGQCWLSNLSGSGSQTERLRNGTPDGGVGFVLVDDQGQQFEYGAKWQGGPKGTKQFLTRIANAEGKTIAKVDYHAPPLVVGGHTCSPCLSGCGGGTTDFSSGAPYISKVTAGNGAEFSFFYKYMDGECVLDRIESGTGVPLVQFDYATSGGSEVPGLLAAVNRPDGGLAESYEYLDGGIIARGGEGMVVYHMEPSSGRVYKVDAPLGSVIITEGAFQGWFGSGDVVTYPHMSAASGSSVSVSSSYVSGAAPGTMGPRIVGVAHSCVGDSVCGTAEEILLWWSSPAGGGMEQGVMTSLADGTPYSCDYSSFQLALGQSIPQEVARDEGAETCSGRGLLHQEMTYSYNATNSQRIVTRTEKSSLAQNDYQLTTTTTTYVGVNDDRVREVAVTGLTLKRTSGNTVTETHSTYYFYDTDARQPCVAVQAGAAYKEIHGPCLQGTNDCAGDAYPITLLEYYPQTAAAPLRGQLHFVRNFPEGCSGLALSTEYRNYDAFGNALEILDVNNGVLTSKEWLGSTHQLTAETRGGARTRYAYSNGKLRTITHPLGNVELFCHRENSDAACASGTWTPRLQWQAKCKDATCADWSEKIEYVYTLDGRYSENLVQKKFWGKEGATAVVRRLELNGATASGSPLREGRGGVPDSAAATPIERYRDYDWRGSLSAIVEPYWTAAPGGFTDCQDDIGGCKLFARDRASRIKEIHEYPVSEGSKTCILYDARGNVRLVVPEQAGNVDCETLNAGAPHARSYLTDDFGNVVRAGVPGISGQIRTEYGPLGNVLERDTPSLQVYGRYQRHSYDRMGRVLSLQVLGGTPTYTLWTREYDEDKTPGTDGGPALENVFGRTRKVIDSFGTTWFSYDASGRVLKESRERAGYAPPANLAPSTTYEYNDNGDLKSLVYPRGRKVEYVYGADTGRISSVLVTWQGVSKVLVDNVVWEPYGELAGYRIAGEPSNARVEYLHGGLSTDQNVACDVVRPGFATSGDKTGLLRGIWVSTEADGVPADGDIFKQVISWRGDQVVQLDSCVRKVSGSARRQIFAYDSLLRLTNYTGLDGPRTFSYGSSGRNGASEAGATLSYHYDSSAPAFYDRLLRVDADSGANNGTRFDYDASGQVAFRAPTNLDSLGMSNSWTTFVYPGDETHGSLEPVFRQAVVGPNSQIWQYYYDYKGRRRMKSSPLGATDEYFYDLDHQLLEDVGHSGLTSAGEKPIDQYVWLDGRPIALIKSRMGSRWGSYPDGEGLCSRDGQPMPCGIYYPITDHIGKPVLMLNEELQITGYAEYEPFGYPNRQSLNRETPRPYPANTVMQLGSCNPGIAWANQAVRSRIHVSYFDADASNLDLLFLKDSAGGVHGSTRLIRTAGSVRLHGYKYCKRS